MKTELEKEILNTMTKNLNNWKGPFYFNRSDARISVPKYNPSMGWTLNFASPYSYILMFAIALIIILFTHFLK